MSKINLSDMDRRALLQFAHIANNGCKNVGHNDLSELLGVSNPKLFNICLKRLVKVGFLEYKGWKNNQHWYSLTQKGSGSALSISDDKRRPKKLAIKERTRHLGITTTEKVTVVTPMPSSLVTESKTALGAGINANSVSGHGTYSQEDKKIIDFNSEEKKSRTKTFEAKRKNKPPKGIDYV